MLGSLVVIAVRWHSIAFPRHSRTGSVSLDDLFKYVVSVICRDEKMNRTPLVTMQRLTHV
jgi:hypothetical protein